MPGVWYWGRAFRAASGLAGATPVRQRHAGCGTRAARRVAEMRRRPRIREAAEDEDDSGTGTWVIRPDEPQESVEDPFGLQRPTDRADEVDPEGSGRLALGTAGGPRRADAGSGEGDPPRRRRTAANTARNRRCRSTPGAVSYPEWDYRVGHVSTPGAIVREAAPLLGDRTGSRAHSHVTADSSGACAHGSSGFVRAASGLGVRLRDPNSTSRNTSTAAADFRAGVVGEDRLYLDVRPGRRELSVALLVDVSASTDSWVSGHQRIVDVEKDALLVVCEALSRVR